MSDMDNACMLLKGTYSTFKILLVILEFTSYGSWKACAQNFGKFENNCVVEQNGP